MHSQTHSLERKQSMSSWRKGSKGLKYASCPLPLHQLQHLLSPQARGLQMLCHACPRDVVAGEPMSSSLLVLPQLPQHPVMLTVGSSSSAPTRLQATEAGSFPWTPGAWCLQPSGLAHPHASIHQRLRTPGSCPCAPCPDHHPGSAGPERRRTKQPQKGSARHHGHQRSPAGCTTGSSLGTLPESPPSC